MSSPDKYNPHTFGDAELPLAKTYVRPLPRSKMLWWGLAATLVMGAIIAVLVLWFDRGGLANGPVASAHASFENDCAACHESFASVPNQKCSTCHEKFGDQLGVFSMTAHTVYRSNDFSRVAPHDQAANCRDCHQDHLGRDASITSVDNHNCTTCHDIGSFNSRHPAFALPTVKTNLRFAHAAHVHEIMKQHDLSDLERACLYCHNPDEKGAGFTTLSFDKHCDSCHLSSSSATPRLPITASTTGKPGVMMPATFLTNREPDSAWAEQMSLASFNRSDGGSFVTKRGVEHADPWILANLRQLRKRLYPEEGLTELLRASPDVAPRAVHRLYEEAVASLQAQADELRGRPERKVQRELADIDRELAAIRRQLEDPYVTLDQTKFLGSVNRQPADLAPEEVENIRALMTDLAQPCTPCHAVYDGLIGRIDNESRTFARAEFNHRAHIIQRRCLDCHAAIPMDEASAKANGHSSPLDSADIVNLPSIETCQDCHQDNKTSNRCVTCHEFHPHKERRSNLLLYLD